MLPVIFPVTSHTKHVGQGSTFVALRGSFHDGIDFIEEALSKGATTIVVAQSSFVSESILVALKKHNAQLIRIDSPRRALAYLSAQAAGFPAEKLSLIGITGTKGKTTTTFLVEHIFRSAGYTTAVLSTVRNSIGATIFETDLTTRQPDYLHQFFALCVKHTIDKVIIEVAAQASSLNRTDGIMFDGFIFTNFSQEHGEFYATLKEYFDAKKLLALQLKPDCPLVLNADDSSVALLGKEIGRPALFFGESSSNTVTYSLDTTNLSALSGSLIFDGIAYPFKAPALAGKFNIYNCMAAATLAYALDIDPKIICAALETFLGVPGRMQKHMLPNNACAFIDYAHTPSSFEAILETLRPLTSQLIVVFGCGGDRDKTKRSVMGKIAAEYADYVVLTSDNPRSEDPLDIINTIVRGIPENKRANCFIEIDREKAIRKAYELSSARSVIALLGKGPDEYQLIKGVKIPFSEREILEAL